MLRLDVVHHGCTRLLERCQRVDGHVCIGQVFTHHIVSEGGLRGEARVARRNFFRSAVDDHLVGFLVCCGDIVQHHAADFLGVALRVVGHGHEGVEARLAKVEGEVCVFLAVAFLELGDDLCVVVRSDDSGLVLDLRRGQFARICAEDHLRDIRTEGQVHRHFAVVAVVGLRLDGVVHAGEAVNDALEFERIGAEAAEARDVVTGVEHEAAVAVIIADRVAAVEVAVLGCEIEEGAEALAALNPVGVVVVEIDRVDCIAFRLGGPVVVVEAEVLLRNGHELEAVAVVVLRVPGELDGSVHVVTPDTVALVALCHAGTDAVDFVVLDVGGMDFAPPALIEGSVAEVHPFHAQHVIVECDGLVEILRCILRIVDGDAQFVGGTHFGVREGDGEGRFGLAVGEVQRTHLENVCRRGHFQRNGDGTGGVLTHGGEGRLRSHRRVERVASGRCLRREVDAVATRYFFLTRRVRVYLRLAGEEEGEHKQKGN